MTMPTTSRKISVFFFTGLDRSRLTNLDRSRFEKEHNHCTRYKFLHCIIVQLTKGLPWSKDNEVNSVSSVHQDSV